MQRLRRIRLSYANLVSTLCLFLLLSSGVAYAATHLGKNSVGNKQIKKSAVTGIKVKDQSLTGADIKLSTLGTVPSAASSSHSVVADTANGLTAPEPPHVIGAPGQPPFRDGSKALPIIPGVNSAPISFYKDHEGIVHLEGIVEPGEGEEPLKGIIFTLPPGFRPAAGTASVFVAGGGEVVVFGSNTNLEGKSVDGDVLVGGSVGVMSSMTYRAES